MARTISLQSDLGGRLRFQQLQGRESLGQPYRYVLSALCSGDPPDPSRLLGTPFGISLVHDNGSRHLHGIVAAVALLGQREVGDERFTAIEVTLVPRLWLLGQQHDSRIFSGQSVADIVRTLLSEIGCTDVRLQLGAILSCAIIVSSTMSRAWTSSIGCCSRKASTTTSSTLQIATRWCLPMAWRPCHGGTVRAPALAGRARAAGAGSTGHGRLAAAAPAAPDALAAG
ncbi:contractile injection system protein, VgrG/Pvc8 family [Stenotrophomonas sp. CD2]|nr:contractile injection system protein, VgrG/Pvc8 family [Stenotrophomonas sp. CD2]